MVSLVKYRELQGVRKLLTKVFTFDLLTKGGIPEGRFTLFYGDKSTSKSTFALRVAKRFLEEYPDREVCYVDFENTFDKEWADRIMGTTDGLLVGIPAYAEEGAALLQEAVKDPKIGLYIIDSLAAVVSMAEAESSPEQTSVGIIARTINHLLRKFVPGVVKNNREGNPVTVILINQLRHKVDKTAYMPTYTMPGGKFQEALVSLEVRFYQDKVHKGADDIPTRIDYSFVIEKNKTGGIPKVVGKYGMYVRTSKTHRIGDIADAPIILEFLKSYHSIEKTKNGYVLFGEEYPSQLAIAEAIRSDTNLYRRVLEEITRRFYEV